MLEVVLTAVLATGTLGLEEAIALSDSAPEASAARLAAKERAASVATIAALSSNPLLTLQPALRTISGAPFLEGQLSLQQSVALEPLQALRREQVTQDAAQARALNLEHAWARRSATARAWLDAWSARATTNAARGEALAAAELVGKLERAESSGGVLRVELESARTFAAEAEALVLSWEGREFDASAELSMLVGTEELVTVAEEPGSVEAPALDAVGPSARAPHLRLLDAQVEAARGREREARALWGATLHLSLFGGYEAQAQWLTGLGVGLSLPVFERGQVEAAAQHSLVTRLTGERTMSQRRAAIQLAVLRHELEHTAEVQAVVAGRQLPAAREALRLETRRFEQGEATVQELLLLRRQAFAAQAAALAARAEVLAARVKAREYVIVLGELP